MRWHTFKPALLPAKFMVQIKCQAKLLLQLCQVSLYSTLLAPRYRPVGCPLVTRIQIATHNSNQQAGRACLPLLPARTHLVNGGVVKDPGRTLPSTIQTGSVYRYMIADTFGKGVLVVAHTFNPSLSVPSLTLSTTVFYHALHVKCQTPLGRLSIIIWGEVYFILQQFCQHPHQLNGTCLPLPADLTSLF